MALSQLARSISESPTLALNEKAMRMRERGEAVINLGIGEPKNKTPISAVHAAAAKLSDGEIKYTPPDGQLSLKKAVIRYTEDHYDRLVAPENVIICAGAKMAIFNVLYTLLNPQDEVILLAPYWVTYPEIVRMLYGQPVVVAPEDGTFHPRLQDIEEAVGSYTKAIIVNSPNNPSGVVFDDGFMADLVAFCERKDLFLILDDIYHMLVFDGRTPPNALRFSKRDLDSSKIIVINGISKLYGMTGFRIGWAVASRSVIEVMTNVQAQTTSCPSSLLQAAAEGAPAPERHGLAAHVDGKQPRHHPARTGGAARRPHRATRRDVLLPAGLSGLPGRLRRAFALPARNGAGGDGPWAGVRHGGAPALELRRFPEGRLGRHRPHPLGARSQRAGRDLYR
jgi:aspartate aminotransferase